MDLCMIKVLYQSKSVLTALSRQSAKEFIRQHPRHLQQRMTIVEKKPRKQQMAQDEPS